MTIVALKGMTHGRFSAKTFRCELCRIKRLHFSIVEEVPWENNDFLLSQNNYKNTYLPIYHILNKMVANFASCCQCTLWIQNPVKHNSQWKAIKIFEWITICPVRYQFYWCDLWWSCSSARRLQFRCGPWLQSVRTRNQFRCFVPLHSHRGSLETQRFGWHRQALKCWVSLCLRCCCLSENERIWYLKETSLNK